MAKIKIFRINNDLRYADNNEEEKKINSFLANIDLISIHIDIERHKELTSVESVRYTIVYEDKNNS